jgi:ferredoxin-NADP reductase
MLSQPGSPASVLALVTTFHLGLATLRNHRSSSPLPVGPLAMIAFALTALPWVFPSPVGLAFGVGVHLAWFAACELLSGSSTPAPARAHATAAPPGHVRPRMDAPAPRPPARSAPAAPRGFLQVPVLATVDETPAVKTIRLARPDGFTFQAGQFMPVRVRVDGRELTRCYSISSAPAAAGYLEISVRRQGVVSNALHATARAGTLVSIRQPAGGFVYPAGDDRPMVLIAGGIGVTPLMSMLRHAVLTEPTRRVTLLYGAHTEADFAFRDELECLAWRHPQFHLQLAASKGTTAPRVYPGRVDAELLRTAVPDIADAISLVCGPAAMIECIRGLLAAAGVPAPQIRYEKFDAAVAAAADAPPRSARPSSRASTYHVSCTKAARDVDVRAGQSLLEAAEEGGVEIPSLCRAGVCGTCRVRVAHGTVDCESPALDADEVNAGFVLACVASVRSDCEVEI